ncbi:MAG: PAS domain-containing protein [Mycobacterium leprae]
MKPGLVRPSGVERTFGEDEIIVTKTDPRGVITYANRVFLRVSAYDEPDVIGQPHNLIRHPGMPRTVFQLLWDTIRGGREMFAYIVNLAADGAHYWVFAHVTPSFGPAGRIVGSLQPAVA